MFDWFKNLYYDWFIDTFLFKNTTISDTTYLNPFNVGGASNLSELRQEQNYNLINEGVKTIKYKINSQENPEQFLKKFSYFSDDWKKGLEAPDLIDLADDPLPLWKAALFNKLTVRKADIITRQDKEKMIEKRIGHYKELQVKKQIRQLNRQLRKAQHENDLDTVETLTGEIDELTKQLTNQRRS